VNCDSDNRSRNSCGLEQSAGCSRSRQLSLVVLVDWHSLNSELAIIVELTSRRCGRLGSNVLSDALSIDCSSGSKGWKCVTHDGENVEERLDVWLMEEESKQEDESKKRRSKANKSKIKAAWKLKMEKVENVMMMSGMKGRRRELKVDGIK
jgi:hypothetical protein